MAVLGIFLSLSALLLVMGWIHDEWEMDME